ncbi:VirK family protein [Legionella sp. CNM-4043-24]|uniref:VirK family protein n=1 Tax=Legionella sp. CNM-4043-24 TaxID=3421646 RepID=UPI00403AA165
MNNMKKWMMASLFLIAKTASADAVNLPDYAAVKSAVSKGSMVRIAINFAQCTAVKNSIPAVDGMALFTPNEIVLASDGRIVASLTHFTLNDPNFPRHATYQHIQYMLKDNNHLTLSAVVLNATDFSPMGEEAIVDCAMGSGAKIYS